MPHETRYVRPPAPHLDDLTRRALAAAGDSASGVAWVEHGSNTLVALGENTAVRIARQRSAGPELLRAQRLVDALPDLPFEVPRSRAEPVDVDGLVALPVQRLRGEHAPPSTPDLGTLRELLESVHGIDTSPLEQHLAPRRAFCGGEAWQKTLRERVVPLLDPDLRTDATGRIDDLAAIDQVTRAINHGDLGASNILWHGDRVSAVLDWDLTALEDSAEDVSTVATSFAVWPRAHELADAETVRRAEAFRRTIPLQIIAFAVINDRPDAELRRTVARCERSLHATADTADR